MATSRRSLTLGDLPQSDNDAGRELFEACRNGDINKVKKLVTSQNVNAKDTAGRRSSPLHFAAGETANPIFSFFSPFISVIKSPNMAGGLA